MDGTEIRVSARETARVDNDARGGTGSELIGTSVAGRTGAGEFGSILIHV